MLTVLIVLKDLMVLGDWKPLILLQVSKMKCSHDCVSTKESTTVTSSTSWCLSAMFVSLEKDYHGLPSVLCSLNLSTDSPQQRIPGFWNSESRYDSSFIFIIFHKHTYMSLVLFSGPWWLHLWLRFTKRINVLKNMMLPNLFVSWRASPIYFHVFCIKTFILIRNFPAARLVWWHWRITSP